VLFWAALHADPIALRSHGATCARRLNAYKALPCRAKDTAHGVCLLRGLRNHGVVRHTVDSNAINANHDNSAAAANQAKPSK